MIGFGVVGGSLGVVVARRSEGEAVHGVAVVNQFPVDFSIFHFFGERGHIGIGDVRVVCAMQGHHAGFDVRRHLLQIGLESAVEADHCSHTRTLASQFQNRGSTKTVTDGHHTGFYDSGQG